MKKGGAKWAWLARPGGVMVECWWIIWLLKSFISRSRNSSCLRGRSSSIFGITCRGGGGRRCRGRRCADCCSLWLGSFLCSRDTWRQILSGTHSDSSSGLGTIRRYEWWSLFSLNVCDIVLSSFFSFFQGDLCNAVFSLSTPCTVMWS